MTSRRPLMKLIAAAAVTVAALPAAAGAATGVPDRESDPVVLTGADVPALLGIAPGSLVAFAWDDGWEQVPVQVDERALVNYAVVRQFHQTRPFEHEAYTDPGTFAGADPDPSLDGGDEIAMMARDAGADAGAEPAPPGAAAGSRVAVAVDDPLDAAATRFIYLFRTDSGLDPAAGRSYVDYDFSLDSGDYKTTYSFSGVPGGDGGNPTEGPANTEDSTVTTPVYTQHLLSRWIADGLQISAGGASGADILDGDKAQVSRGCGRSELTFSRGGGGFIVNKSGPVRAIRSYIGANSGTFTQRDDIFYERRQDTFTYLRVHAGISQVSQYLDYSPAATGMTYTNSSVYPASATIDGVPDAAIPVPSGNALQTPEAEWEQANGPQGSLSVITRVEQNVPGFTPGYFYRDEGAGPDFEQCGGYADALSYGSSGSEFKSGGANTDPTLGEHYDLTAQRTIYYGAPFADVAAGAADAARRSEQVDNPLAARVVGAGATPARLRPAAKAPRHRVRAGKRARIAVSIGNDGDSAAHAIELCPRPKRRLAEPGRCKHFKRLGPGGERSATVSVVPTRRAARRGAVRVRVVATAGGERTATAVVLRVRRHGHR